MTYPGFGCCGATSHKFGCCGATSREFGCCGCSGATSREFGCCGATSRKFGFGGATSRKFSCCGTTSREFGFDGATSREFCSGGYPLGGGSPSRATPMFFRRQARSSQKLPEVSRLCCCPADTVRRPVLYIPGQCLEVRHGHVARGILAEVVIVGRLDGRHRLWWRRRRRGGRERGRGVEVAWLCAVWCVCCAGAVDGASTFLAGTNCVTNTVTKSSKN